MDAPTPIGPVQVPRLGFLDHICKHHGTTTEVVGMDPEEQGPAHEDDIAGSEVKLWVLRYDVAFVWSWDVGIDKRRAPGSFGRGWRSGWVVRVVYPSVRVDEENVLEEIRQFSPCGAKKIEGY